jgi:DNA replication protein DnaC
LASALVESACRHRFTATYVRVPRLLHELAVSRGDRSYVRVSARLAKLHLPAIDDTGLLAPLSDAERRDLLKVIDDRTERRSMLIASQLPPKARHAAIVEPNVTDPICDRPIHRAHKLTLKGPTMRDRRAGASRDVRLR